MTFILSKFNISAQEQSTTKDIRRSLDPLTNLFTTNLSPKLSSQKDSHGTKGLEKSQSLNSGKERLHALHTNNNHFQEALIPALLHLNRYNHNCSLPPTVVLAVVVVVEVALVVVPFLVPVTNSIWEGRDTQEKGQKRKMKW